MYISFRNFSIEIFGSSHGEEIGVQVKNFPKGVRIDHGYIVKMLERRRPGKSRLTTLRDESDEVEIRSGITELVTDGNDIVGIIKNRNQQSKDYSKLIHTPRPAHADLTAFLKYHGKLDMSGGGPFSGRLTAPLVFIGAIAKKEIEKKGIYIVSHLRSIGSIKDFLLNDLIMDEKQKESIERNIFPVIDSEVSKRMVSYIDDIRNNLDSIGSTIETVIYGAPAGCGEHSEYSVESMLSKTVFCIPGVKAIEFGKGFSLAGMTGSKSNDSIFYDDNLNIKTKTNHMGGILGGITNGMPVIFTIAMKATPSIAQEQKTINTKTMENVIIKVEGRHDPCIGIRAVPVVEAVSALVFLDYLLENEKNEQTR